MKSQSVEPFIYGDTMYYNALGRNIKTLNEVKGFESRISYFPWLTVAEVANDTTENTLFSGTPDISVVDNRGLVIGQLQYNRTSIDDELDEYISRNTYTVLGFAETSIDPRLFKASQEDATIVPNTSSKYMLDGTIIYQHNVDAGKSMNMVNVEGNVFWSVLSNDVEHHTTFDILGRITALYENRNQSPCRQRTVYGDEVQGAMDYNLNGKPIRVNDTAGLVSVDSYSMNGEPFEQKRQLLANLEPESDWHGESENQWQALLEPTIYETNMLYNAIGKVVSQKDAKGNIKNTEYDVSGKIHSTSVQLNNNAN
jgi:insecticidal toxin complex protein TccC